METHRLYQPLYQVFNFIGKKLYSVKLFICMYIHDA